METTTLIQADARSHAQHKRLALLRRTGLFGCDYRGAYVRRARTLDDFRQAYRLVHEVFVAAGYISPHPTRMRLRVFEASTAMATFVAKVGERVVGVLSMLGDTPDMGLPADSVYRAELDALRATGARLCEITNQAIVPEYRKSAITTELMRCAMAHALAMGYDEGIAVVSPGHSAFYHVLGFREVGCIRSYSTTIDDPVGAMSLAFQPFRQPLPLRCLDGGTGGLPTGEGERVEEFVWQYLKGTNPFLEAVKSWQFDARRAFLVPELLQRLFIVEGKLLERCSEREIDVLKHRWGRYLFEHVATRSVRRKFHVRLMPPRMPQGLAAAHAR